MHPFQHLRGVYHGLPTLAGSATAVTMVATFLVLLYLGWMTVNLLTTGFDDHEEIVARRNLRFIIIRSGMVIGLIAALVPLLSAHTTSRSSDLMWLGLGGLAVIAVFNLIRPLLNWMLLQKMQSANGLRDVSYAVAIVQFSFYVAGGLIIGGAFLGTAPTVHTAVAATIVFVLLGFGALVATYLFIGKRYGMNRRIKNDNAAAALILGSLVIGLGFILQSAIAGDFEGWMSGFVGFFLRAIVGIVVLVAILLPALDKLILRGITFRKLIETNAWEPAIAMGIIVAGTACGMSHIFL